MTELKEIKMKINIGDIKSSYIRNEVFSFLPEKQKLNMIIYNKKLQKKIHVDLEFYKKISKKYKIEGITGKGKEYDIDTNRLLFEGEYLDGKKMEKEKNFMMMVN